MMQLPTTSYECPTCGAAMRQAGVTTGLQAVLWCRACGSLVYTKDYQTEDAHCVPQERRAYQKPDEAELERTPVLLEERSYFTGVQIATGYTLRFEPKLGGDGALTGFRLWSDPPSRKSGGS